MMAPRRKAERGSSLVGRLKRLDVQSLPLVGRDTELQQLIDAFRYGSHPLIAVTGLSGVGKTTFVEKGVGKEITKSGDWFIVGKFDQQASSRPYSGIAAAVEQLDEDHYDEVLGILEKTPMEPTQAALVSGVLPALTDIFAPQLAREKTLAENDAAAGGSLVQDERLSYRSEQILQALVAFFRTISKHQKIVLLLDDVQWADEASLNLVRGLVTSNGEGPSNLTVIITYRSNEVHRSQPLAALLDIGSPLSFTLGNLSVEDLNMTLTRLLQRQPDEVMELSKVIHRKTQGNIFFALQLMTWLQSKLFVYYSLQNYRWEWNVADIDAESDVSDNVVEVVTSKLRNLTPVLKKAVMVGSCLGSHFDKSLLFRLVLVDGVLSMFPTDSTPLEELHFESLLNEGIVTQRTADTFRFSHDRVQQAAYSLFETAQARERTHFEIGQYLLYMRATRASSSLATTDFQLLLAIDQVNLGSSCITGEARMMELVRNNHEAAVLAMKMSAFWQAERFLRKAATVLPKRVLWTENYRLAISIHSKWADTLLTTGKLEEIESVADEVVRNSQSPLDCSSVAYSKMNSLACQNRLQACLSCGYSHMKKVGIKLPLKPSKVQLIREFQKAKKHFKRTPIDKLLQMPECSAADDLLHQILQGLSDTAWITHEKNKMLYMHLRLVNMGFEQGPSVYTANGVVYYGAILFAMGNIEGASQVSTWAERLAERFRTRFHHARIVVANHYFLYHLRRPVQDSLDIVLQSYNEAMRAGDMDGACYACQTYVLFYFVCGYSLGALANDIRKYLAIFQGRSSCEHIRCWVELLGQAILNLKGDNTNDPFVLDGEFVSRNAFLEKATTEKNVSALSMFCSWSIEVAYVLDRSSAQLREAFDYSCFSGKLPPLEKTTKFAGIAVQQLMALVAIELERQTGKWKYARKKRFFIKSLQRMQEKGVPGVLHRTQLLEAEEMTLNKKMPESAVKAAFDKAISTASRAGFVPERALGNELCGKYFERRGDQDWAIHYLGQALHFYREWGAMAKVRLMEEKYHTLRRASFFARKASSVRSRERFSSCSADIHGVDLSTLIYKSEEFTENSSVSRNSNGTNQR